MAESHPQTEMSVRAQTSSSRRETKRSYNTVNAVLFFGPGLAMFFVFVALPAVGGLALAFFDWNLFGTPEFVGVKHLVRLFGDERMWHSLWVSLMFVLLGVLPATLGGFVLAVIASASVPGAGAIRALYFAPMVASSAAAAVLWSSIYNSKFGLVNQTLAMVGITGPNWLNDPMFARPALVIVIIWSSIPVVTILYIAAIQKVPEDLYSAASLDGAGRWRQLWNITWPSVTSTTLVVLVLMFITFLGGTLEFALLMTGGGPVGETTSLALYSYKAAFENRNIGYASALAFFQLALIIVLFLAGRSVAKKVRFNR